ncbi:TolC family protein [Cetobacterium sp. SF1]|uniref:TolC family protein n=1 Tax=Cetobacterium sp. SF1 TaxID=3417654 RepID=UPI003CF6D408
MRRVLIMFFCILVGSVEVFCKPLGVGVLIDKSEMAQGIIEELKGELKLNFAGTDYEPQIIEAYEVNNGNFKSSLEKLEKNSKINGIFLLTYEKPSDVKFLNKNKFYSFPFGFVKNEALNKNKNVNYISGNLEMKDDLALMKELKPIKRMAVFVPVETVHPGVTLKELEAPFKDSGIGLEIITESSTDEEINNTLEKVDGVYVLSYGNYGKNILEKALEKKKLTFTVDFSSSLNSQSLMGYNLKAEVKRRLRASALNYMMYKTKGKRTLITDVGNIRKNIFFNMNIAHMIDCYPSLIFLQGIESVKEEESKKRFLGFQEAIERALQVNQGLLSTREDVESSIYDAKAANAKRLPQLSLNGQYSAVDKDKLKGVPGTAENSVNTYLKLSQVIFSDQINANVYVKRRLIDNSKASLQQAKLNTIYNVASTYLNILQLKAQLKIQKSNYALVKESLNIAKVNYRVGSGGAQDVYRLEASLSQALANISQATGEIKMQEASLNRLLNYPANSTYNYETFNNISNSFAMGKDFLEKYAYGSKGTTQLLNFLITGAIKNSQNLRELDNSISIKKREYTAAGRERYIPTIEAFGQYNKDNVITPWGRNSDLTGEAEYWQAGVAVTLPLIQGGETIENQNMIKSQIKSLEYKKNETNNVIAEQVTQTFTQMLSDYVQSYTTGLAADAAEKNLKIVTNLYAAGSATLTELLDAQNNTLKSQLNNVIANYSLFNSAIKLENLYGDYTITKSQMQRDEMIKNLEDMMN